MTESPAENSTSIPSGLANPSPVWVSTQSDHSACVVNDFGLPRQIHFVSVDPRNKFGAQQVDSVVELSH